MKCVISVLGKDRSGVVAAIATTLADCGANIDDISQTIDHGNAEIHHDADEQCRCLYDDRSVLWRSRRMDIWAS